MNLPQALEIVQDHIRIGKGMELTNGVPEALDVMVFAVEKTIEENKRLRNVLEYISETEPCRYEQKLRWAQFREGFAFNRAEFEANNPVCECLKCIVDEALRKG